MLIGLNVLPSSISIRSSTRSPNESSSTSVLLLGFCKRNAPALFTSRSCNSSFRAAAFTDVGESDSEGRFTATDVGDCSAKSGKLSVFSSTDVGENIVRLEDGFDVGEDTAAGCCSVMSFARRSTAAKSTDAVDEKGAVGVDVDNCGTSVGVSAIGGDGAEFVCVSTLGGSAS